MNKRKLVRQIEKRIIDSDVGVAIEYLNMINHETGLMEEDTIYYNDEDFFVMIYGDNMLEAIMSIKYGTYNSDDEYVVINRYGNVDSYSSREIKEYIRCIAHIMAEIFAEDYIKGEGKFKGLEIYKDL